MCTSGAKIKRPAVCHNCRGKYYCNTYNILQLYFYVLFIFATLYVLQGEAINIDDALSSLNKKAPCIVGFGETRSEASDFKVLIENVNILTMPSLLSALHYCFAAYYVFNISFPPQYRLVLLFMEQYVYGLNPSQKTPISVSIIIDSLEKILLKQ